MPRKPLIRSREFPYHIVNQVNNKDFFYLPQKVVWQIVTDACRDLTEIYDAKIHGLVLMSNHFHLILTSPTHDIGVLMKHYSESITRTHNRMSNRLGHLFRGGYRGTLIQTPSYFETAMKYLYRNPVKAKIAYRVQDYTFSSLGWQIGNNQTVLKIERPIPNDFQKIYDMDLGKYLEWLNTPFRSEDLDAIRKALKRTVFKLPKTGYLRKERQIDAP